VYKRYRLGQEKLCHFSRLRERSSSPLDRTKNN
jgi:hypothetical protein